MDEGKMKSRVQENLLRLYLRLNGYFLTGFIVHSPIHGHNKTEIDALAVRFPFHTEPEREIGPDTLLEPSNTFVDFLICEVKSRGQKLQFNDALIDSDSAIESVLRWAGLFSEKEISELAPAIREVFSPGNPPRAEIPTIAGPRSTRVRGLLCSPERNEHRSNQPWFLPGPPMMKYLWECFVRKSPDQLARQPMILGHGTPMKVIASILNHVANQTREQLKTSTLGC